MKKLLLLALCLNVGNAYGQYFVTRANHALASIDSFLVQYGINENQLQKFQFEHPTSSEVNPLPRPEYQQKQTANISTSSFSIIPNDTVLIRACIVSVKEAQWLSLLLTNYKLSKAGKLFFYSGDHSAFAGPILSNVNNKAEMLPTLRLDTDQIVLVLIDKEDTKTADLSRLMIEQVWSGRDKRASFLAKSTYQLLNNSPNAACYFPEWRYESDAIARMDLPNGSGSCSCTLLNNENNDRIPYIMTSRHCLTNSNFDPFNISAGEINQLNQTNFLFLFRHRDCGGNVEEQAFTVTGATYLDSYFWTDHLLIRLNAQNLPPFLNYVGWDRSVYPFGSSFTVSGISHPSSIRQKYTFGTANRPGVDSYKYGVSWSVGSTEQGSSGSALFNSNHKFVGQLAYSTTYDNYGRFSEVWQTPYGGARNWLSPSQNLTSINPLIPMVMYGPTRLCYGSQGTVSMPHLLPVESATWSVTPNLQIVSSTNNSVVITPNGPSASGRGTVTATIAGQSKTIDLLVGIPDQSNISVTNQTTNYSNSNLLPFCFFQSNTVTVSAINPALGSNEAEDAQWIFPTDWSPNTASGTQVQTIPYNLNGNTSFSVRVRNACGWQNYPVGYGTYFIQCGGYYSYQVYPNPASDVITVDFEKTEERKSFPETFEIYPQDSKETTKGKPIRSWSTTSTESTQELYTTKKLNLQVADLPRGTYILHVKKEQEKDETKKVDVIRILLQ